METTENKEKAEGIVVKLIVLLIFLSFPFLKMSSRNVSITSCNSGKGNDYPINCIMELAGCFDNNENNIPVAIDAYLSNDILTPVVTDKVKGGYILMFEYPNPEGIFETKGLSP